MTSNFFNSELSELTSEKNRNSELRSENSEDIVRFGNYSKLALRKFRISFATSGAISELHSEKNSEFHSENISELHSDKNSV